MTTTAQPDAPATKGRVLHNAWGYDLLAWLVLRGREPAFRDRVLDLAQVAAGESVLDVGCGTGTLAIRAKHRVGATGTVRGIDASPEKIARARKKAIKAGVDVGFEPAVVEALPFAAATFDVVLSTLMLHHLPRPARQQCAAELRRVARPGGRVVVVDFTRPTQPRKGLLAHLHRRHGGVPLEQIIELVTAAGLVVGDTGPVGFADLSYIVATAP
jgi:ubiquinone/menaquinone biosynthesis C-methylase UbiE